MQTRSLTEIGQEIFFKDTFYNSPMYRNNFKTNKQKKKKRTKLLITQSPYLNQGTINEDHILISNC